MKNGVIRGIAVGTLMGAGALWAMNSMTKKQKRTLGKFASDTAAKVMDKASEIMK